MDSRKERLLEHLKNREPEPDTSRQTIMERRYIDVSLGDDIDTLINKLFVIRNNMSEQNAFIKESVVSIDEQQWSEYSEPSYNLEITYGRPETDEERESRINTEIKIIEDNKRLKMKMEYDLYLTLKEKFEK